MRNQGQGHIRQRGQRSWELKFDLGRDPVTGKRISRENPEREWHRQSAPELRLIDERT